jgi:DNA-binding response OmpR family regulator
MALILVIDDDEAMRRVILRTLGAKKHRVIEAPNGIDAMKLVEDHKPDAVISDILMPHKEGIETIREIRERAPGVKIIAISGGGISHNLMFLDVARAFGADAVLAKPFRPNELTAVVEQVLRQDPGARRQASGSGNQERGSAS